MCVAGMLSVLVKALGLFKESTIAYFFGVSTFVDFYVLALVFVAFFVAPVGGTLATLLTQKYIEISAKISQAAADVVYGQCQVFGLSCMAIILLLQIGSLQIPLVQHYVGNKFAGLEISYITILFPIALLSFLSVINVCADSKKEFYNLHCPAGIGTAIHHHYSANESKRVSFCRLSVGNRGWLFIGICVWSGVFAQNFAFRNVPVVKNPEHWIY